MLKEICYIVLTPFGFYLRPSSTDIVSFQCLLYLQLEEMAGTADLRAGTLVLPLGCVSPNFQEFVSVYQGWYSQQKDEKISPIALAHFLCNLSTFSNSKAKKRYRKR